MEEQLLQAINIASSGPAPGQDPSIVQQALTFIEQVKQNTQEVWSPGWNIFAARQPGTQKPLHDHQQRLFGLSLVTDFLEEKVTATSDPAKTITFLQSAALAHFDEEYVAGVGEHGAGFIKNKFAQFVSNLLVQTYGLPPPFTFLTDLMARVHVNGSSSSSLLNPVATDMVIRILHEFSVSLGSDITLRAIRSRERLQRDSLIRDEIRQYQAPAIAEASWKVIQEGYNKVRSPAPASNDLRAWTYARASAITCAALEVIGDYVSWIDISLVVTPDTVNILLALLQQDICEIRCAAANAIVEIVSKGMKCADKLTLLNVFNLTAVVASLEKQTHAAANESDDFSEKQVTEREHLAKLASTIANELARIAQDVEATQEIRLQADAMLLSHMQCVLEFMADEYDEVVESVLPCVGTTLTIYKKLKRQGGTANTPDRQSPLSVLSTEKAELLSRLMAILLKKMKFAQDSEWSGAHDDSDDVDEAEDTAKFLQLRKQLQNHATAIAGIEEQLFSQPTLALITKTLEASDAFLRNVGPSISWQDAELALFVIYFSGEILASGGQVSRSALSATSFVILPAGTPKATRNKPPEGFLLSMSLNSLGELVQRFFQSSISAFRHPAVQMQYFENAVRYSAFFDIRAEFLGDTLAAFLDWRGIHNDRPAVRIRTHYLFLRFINDTRRHIQPAFVQGIIESLSDMLVVKAHIPTVDVGEDPLEEAVKRSNAFDGQLDLFQSCGVLLNVLRNDPQNQAVLLEALIAPLTKQVQVSKEAHAADKGNLEVVLQTHHLIFALASIAKGFPDLSASSNANMLPWMALYKGVVDQILDVLNSGSLSAFKIIREASRGAFSRIINTTGMTVLPYVPALLKALLPRISEEELIDFYSFLCLITAKYKSEIISIMDEVLRPLLERTFYFMNRDVAGTDDAIQRDHLVKAYLTFISTIVGAGLDDTLRSERNQGQLEVLLQSLVYYASNAQPTNIRAVASIFTRLVGVWMEDIVSVRATGNGSSNSFSPPPRAKMPGFEQFAYKTLTGLVFEVPIQPSFDLADAQSQIALTELCNLAKAIHAKRGQEFVEYLRSSYLPSRNCPSGAAEPVLDALQNLEARAFKKKLEVFVQQVRSGSNVQENGQ